MNVHLPAACYRGAGLARDRHCARVSCRV